MIAFNPCCDQFTVTNRHKYYVTFQIVCNGEVVSEEELSFPVAFFKVLYILLYLAVFSLYTKIKRFIFPYQPTREEAEAYYTNGNGVFDRMSSEEKDEFKKKDSSLPLGL
ncbi:MAG: hypothetical protein D3916_15900 [Candidatus Electrothrix sp. MAN1_4]|nr:hypothetical protein [Candidatus Electrothrix sp. MAN1_4]